MKQAGLSGVSPSHPKLIALLAAGMSLDELVAAAVAAVALQKPFAYALATAEGRRRDATVAPLPARGQAANDAPFRNNHDRRANFMAGLVATPGEHFHATDDDRTFDVDTRVIG